jgi:hypothetical protein
MHASAVDGIFFPADPETLLRKGQFNKDIDVMLGTMAMEGYLITVDHDPALLDPNIITMERVEEIFTRSIKTKYPTHPEYVIQAMVRKAVETYVQDTRKEGLIQAVAQFNGDARLAWPTYLFALHISGNMRIQSMKHRIGKHVTERLEGRTFFYEQRYKPSPSEKPDFIQVDHGDDLLPMQGAHVTNLFGSLPVTLNDDDRLFSQVIFGAWANFGLHGYRIIWQSFCD